MSDPNTEPGTTTRASVIPLAAGHSAVERLTYEVPSQFDGLLQPGHRVLVPVRSRKVTGIVVQVGKELMADSAIGNAAVRPILELLEEKPVLDRPHLELLNFLSSYYLVSLAEACRSIIPAVLRVETRRFLKLTRKPAPLEEASFTPIEREIVQALRRRPMTLRQLTRVGNTRQVAGAVDRLDSYDLLERQEGVRGRHRDNSAATVVHVVDPAGLARLKGVRQRRIVELLTSLSGNAISVSQLEVRLPGATVMLKSLAARGLIELQRLQTSPSPPAADDAPPLELNPEQLAVFGAIAPAIRERRHLGFLLWGVTGSGKTEVYLRLAAEALSCNRQVLVLVPEIALTLELVRAFRARFGPLVGVTHSGQNVAERWASWNAALSLQVRIVIGPRSVTFAPLCDLGLIIVDEEHDPAYKQEEGIRYNARDLAVVLASFSPCPVVLGSATPSAESFANTRSARYRLLRLSRRVQDRPLAQVEVIDLRHQSRADRSKAAAHTSSPQSSAIPISAPLQQAVKENLAAGGQSMIFINRRGFHNSLQCRLCGNVISCPNCSVALTFHLRDRSLQCHYCGARQAAPDKCPECRDYGLEGQGFGTERLAAALAELLPEARIERMDSDTSRRRTARSRILAALRRGEIDILVGTQMIAKGFDFPGVTLVGVVLADLSLNMPDFRSAERTFQLLTQVAGRAGRGDRPGKVLIQTYSPHHYSIRAARDQDYARFIRRELELRRELGYPPYTKIALVRVEGHHPAPVEELALKAADQLNRLGAPAHFQVLGPAPAPIEKLKGRHRWQLMVKSAAAAEMRRALAVMRERIAPQAHSGELRLIIDIDPLNML